MDARDSCRLERLHNLPCVAKWETRYKDECRATPPSAVRDGRLADRPFGAPQVRGATVLRGQRVSDNVGTGQSITKVLRTQSNPEARRSSAYLGVEQPLHLDCWATRGAEESR